MSVLLNTDWQTPAALAVVALTLILFAFRIVRQRKNKGGCGGGCDCPAKPGD
ncbi:MAG: hypothetical protein ACI8XO_003966 [Verrucomicrobiales bacterium]|jgi:hypothetical protein